MGTESGTAQLEILSSMLPASYQEDFLMIVAETGNASEACRRLGIPRMTVYQWRDTRPGFAEQWDAALEVSRERLRQRVLETACAMGLARYVPLTDPDTGTVVLDDNFDPITVPDTSHVDTRVLTKLMDKVMRDEVRQVEQRTRVQYDGPYELVVLSPDGQLIEGEHEVRTDDE